MWCAEPCTSQCCNINIKNKNKMKKRKEKKKREVILSRQDLDTPPYMYNDEVYYCRAHFSSSHLSRTFQAWIRALVRESRSLGEVP